VVQTNTQIKSILMTVAIKMEGGHLLGVILVGTVNTAPTGVMMANPAQITNAVKI
jgi:hypothetical protein